MRKTDELFNEYLQKMWRIHAVRDLVALVGEHRLADELNADTLGQLMIILDESANRCDELVEEIYYRAEPKASADPARPFRVPEAAGEDPGAGSNLSKTARD